MSESLYVCRFCDETKIINENQPLWYHLCDRIRKTLRHSYGKRRLRILLEVVDTEIKRLNKISKRLNENLFEINPMEIMEISSKIAKSANTLSIFLDSFTERNK